MQNTEFYKLNTLSVYVAVDRAIFINTEFYKLNTLSVYVAVDRAIFIHNN